MSNYRTPQGKTLGLFFLTGRDKMNYKNISENPRVVVTKSGEQLIVQPGESVDCDAADDFNSIGFKVGKTRKASEPAEGKEPEQKQQEQTPQEQTQQTEANLQG